MIVDDINIIILMIQRKNIFSVADLLKTILRLAINPTYLALTIGGCFSSFLIAGMFPFLPKYMEVQFMMTASHANLTVGKFVTISLKLTPILGTPEK